MSWLIANTVKIVRLENFKEVGMSDNYDYKQYACVDCKYLGFGIKRNGDEYYYCMCEEGSKVNDEFQQACKHLLLEDEE